jgi:Ecdysteroid kinase-like family
LSEALADINMQHVEESVPEWLDNSFLQKAMRSYRRDDTIEVLSFTMKTGFSEHFASTMFQSQIVFKSSKYPEPQTLNVVIKAKPVNEGLKMKVVSGGPLFETEIRMYNETIPAIHQLFERSGLKVELGPE